MNNTYQQVIIEVQQPETREILVALMADQGFEGFEEERTELKAYIPADRFSPDELQALLMPFGLPYHTNTIEQRNWNAEWEAGFQPVTVENFCTIRADFHPPVPVTKYDIIITPKMSFGTGHHATTYMMVQAMKGIGIQNKRVLDFGTGTGVLAILAEKMGAARILAIDNDSWSIENAAENIGRNQNTRITLQNADAIPEGEYFDLILANINKNVILASLDSMVQHCSEGGLILVSGLLQSDAQDLESAIEKHPLTLSASYNRNSWLCWVLTVKEK